LLQARRPDAVRSPLVFLNLLERYANHVGDVRLAHSQKNSAGAHLLPYVGVHRSSRSAAYRFRHVRNLSLSNETLWVHNLNAASKWHNEHDEDVPGLGSPVAANDLAGVVIYNRQMRLGAASALQRHGQRSAQTSIAAVPRNCRASLRFFVVAGFCRPLSFNLICDLDPILRHIGIHGLQSPAAFRMS
jgi:hypothetical protein